MTESNAYYHMNETVNEITTTDLCRCSDCKEGAVVVILTNDYNSFEDRVSNCCYARAIEEE